MFCLVARWFNLLRDVCVCDRRRLFKLENQKEASVAGCRSAEKRRKEVKDRRRRGARRPVVFRCLQVAEQETSIGMGLFNLLVRSRGYRRQGICMDHRILAGLDRYSARGALDCNVRSTSCEAAWLWPVPATTTTRSCLLPKKFYKIFQILRHIKSLDACMMY